MEKSKYEPSPTLTDWYWVIMPHEWFFEFSWLFQNIPTCWINIASRISSLREETHTTTCWIIVFFLENVFYFSFIEDFFEINALYAHKCCSFEKFPWFLWWNVLKKNPMIFIRFIVGKSLGKIAFLIINLLCISLCFSNNLWMGNPNILINDTTNYKFRTYSEYLLRKSLK